MAAYTPSSPLRGRGRIAYLTWLEALREHGADQPGRITDLYSALAPMLGLNADLALAQACVESGWFTSEAWRRRRNPAGIGITGGGVAGPTFASVGDGIRAHLAHLCCYVYHAAECPILHTDPDPRPDNMARVNWYDPRHFFHLGDPRLAGLRAHAPTRWAADPDYIDKIVRLANGVAGREVSAMSVTERLIEGARARGVETIDQRAKLPVNANHPYRRLPGANGGAASVRHIIQHWTGDMFTRAFFEGLGLPDDGGDGLIDASWTVEQEKRMLDWYARLHIAKDGGVWGGIGYGGLAFPSGRLHIAWDVGVQTYHAFNANAVSYALCCPSSRGQGPTEAQLRAVRAALDVLTRETPEVPATPADVWGHGEAHFLDSRNRGTACPGPALLRFVGDYRAGRVAPLPLVDTDANDAMLEAYWQRNPWLGSKKYAAIHLNRDYTGLPGGDRFNGKVLVCDYGVVGVRNGAVLDLTSRAVDDWETAEKAAGRLHRLGA